MSFLIILFTLLKHRVYLYGCRAEERLEKKKISQQVTTTSMCTIVLNSFGAIRYFRECAPPIRAQIHTKKNNEKTQRRRQQKTVTMTIKDV